LRKKILTKAEEVIPLNIPKRFVVQELAISNSGQVITYICRCDGITIPDIDRYKKPDAVDAKELTPLQKLAKHPDIKTILNCGILTKDEKRQLFGLPQNKGAF
jgi:trehalose-6-phosphatase